MYAYNFFCIPKPQSNRHFRKYSTLAIEPRLRDSDIGFRDFFLVANNIKVFYINSLIYNCMFSSMCQVQQESKIKGGKLNSISV
jgi:hypothetical protein